MTNFPQGFSPHNNLNTPSTSESSSSNPPSPGMEYLLHLAASTLTPSPTPSPSLETYDITYLKREEARNNNNNNGQKRDLNANTPPLQSEDFLFSDFDNNFQETIKAEQTQPRRTVHAARKIQIAVKKEKNPNANTPPPSPSHCFPETDEKDMIPYFVKMTVSPVQPYNTYDLTNNSNNNAVPTANQNSVTTQPSNIRQLSTQEKAAELFQKATDFAYASQQEEAFAAYEKAAHLGHVPAIYHLAMCYELGEGTTQDLAKAAEHYEIAAKAGDQNAMFQLACMYGNEQVVDQSGQAVNQSNEKYAHWLSQAAEHADAQYNLGHCYLEGCGVSTDIQAGIECLKKSAKLGNKNVYNELANFYFSGKLVEKNIEQAFEYLSQSNQLSLLTFKQAFSVCCDLIGGNGVPKDIQKGIAYLLKIAKIGDPDQAFKCYNLAAEYGNLVAMNELGLFHGKGIATPKNYQQSILWFQTVLKQCENLPNPNMIERAQYQVAAYNLGLCYQHGYGVQKILALAMHYYKLAPNHKNALYNYAVLLNQTTSVFGTNKQDSITILKKSLELGKKDIAHRLKCLNLLVKLGDVSSINDLAICFEEGYGVVKNIPLAVQLYQLGAGLGNVNCMFHLGVCYEEGVGVAQNYARAAELYKKAGNHEGAQVALAKLIKKGRVPDQDPSEGAKMLLDAAQNGNKEAYDEVINQLSKNNHEEDSDFDTSSSN